MSDWLPDTPSVARQYCPGCEPDADPIASILEVRWCPRHAREAENRAGSADEQAQEHTTGGAGSGSAESGGDNNRQWCNFFHGRKVERVAEDNKPVEEQGYP